MSCNLFGTMDAAIRALNWEAAFELIRRSPCSIGRRCTRALTPFDVGHASRAISKKRSHQQSFPQQMFAHGRRGLAAGARLSQTSG